MSLQSSFNRRVLVNAKSLQELTILVNLVWGSARPPRPRNSIFALDVKYAGVDHGIKLARVHQELEKQKGHSLVVTMLDEVAWLFNLRRARRRLQSRLLWLRGSHNRQHDPLCQPGESQPGRAGTTWAGGVTAYIRPIYPLP